MEAGSKSLIEFLQQAAEDPELGQRFMRAGYSAGDPEAFARDPELLKVLKKYGWDGLSAEHQRILLKQDNLAEIRSAVDNELKSRPHDDVSAHQGIPIGPCWALVRI